MVSADDEARGKPHSSPPEGHDTAHQADRPVSGAVATAGAMPRPAAGSRPSSGGSLNDGQGKESRPTTRGTVRSHSSGSLSRADTRGVFTSSPAPFGGSLTSFSDGGGSSGTSQEAIRSKTGDKQTRPRGGVAWDDQSSGGAPGSHVPRPPSAPMESSRPRPRSRLSQAQQQQQHSEMLVIADDDQGVGGEIVDDSSGGDEGQRSEGGSAVKAEVVEEEEGQEKEKEKEEEEGQEKEKEKEKEKEEGQEKEEYQQRIQQTAERLGRTESEDEKWIAEVDAQVAALKAKMAAETSASEKGGSALPHHGEVSDRVQYVTEEGIEFARKAMAALDGDSSQEAEAELVTASMEGGWDILCDGRYLEAAEIFTVGLEVNPDEAALLANRSAAWLELERYHEAAADAEACYRLQPDDPVSLMRLGTVYMCMGDLRPAMSLFRDGASRFAEERSQFEEYMRQCYQQARQEGGLGQQQMSYFSMEDNGGQYQPQPQQAWMQDERVIGVIRAYPELRGVMGGDGGREGVAEVTFHYAAVMLQSAWRSRVARRTAKREAAASGKPFRGGRERQLSDEGSALRDLIALQQAAADDDWMGREDDEDVIIYSQGMREGMGDRGGWHRQGGEFGDVGDTEAGMAWNDVDVPWGHGWEGGNQWYGHGMMGGLDTVMEDEREHMTSQASMHSPMVSTPPPPQKEREEEEEEEEEEEREEEDRKGQEVEDENGSSPRPPTPPIPARTESREDVLAGGAFEDEEAAQRGEPEEDEAAQRGEPEEDEAAQRGEPEEDEAAQRGEPEEDEAGGNVVDGDASSSPGVEKDGLGGGDEERRAAIKIQRRARGLSERRKVAFARERGELPGQRRKQVEASVVKIQSRARGMQDRRRVELIKAGSSGGEHGPDVEESAAGAEAGSSLAKAEGGAGEVGLKSETRIEHEDSGYKSSEEEEEEAEEGSRGTGSGQSWQHMGGDGEAIDKNAGAERTRSDGAEGASVYDDDGESTDDGEAGQAEREKVEHGEGEAGGVAEADAGQPYSASQSADLAERSVYVGPRESDAPERHVYTGASSRASTSYGGDDSERQVYMGAAREGYGEGLETYAEHPRTPVRPSTRRRTPTATAAKPEVSSEISQDRSTDSIAIYDDQGLESTSYDDDFEDGGAATSDAGEEAAAAPWALSISGGGEVLSLERTSYDDDFEDAGGMTSDAGDEVSAAPPAVSFPGSADVLSIDHDDGDARRFVGHREGGSDSVDGGQLQLREGKEGIDQGDGGVKEEKEGREGGNDGEEVMGEEAAPGEGEGGSEEWGGSEQGDQVGGQGISFDQQLFASMTMSRSPPSPRNLTRGQTAPVSPSHDPRERDQPRRSASAGPRATGEEGGFGVVYVKSSARSEGVESVDWEKRLKNYAEDDLPLQLSATHRRFMLKPASVYGLDPKARARINFFLGIKVEESVSEVDVEKPPVAPFVQTLFDIFMNPENANAVRWSHEGRAIWFYDTRFFEKRIIPKHFAGTFRSRCGALNGTTFDMFRVSRLLRKYGFIRVDQDEMEFAHPYFVEGRGDLLHTVRRRAEPERGPTGEGRPIAMPRNWSPVPAPGDDVSTLPPHEAHMAMPETADTPRIAEYSRNNLLLGVARPSSKMQPARGGSASVQRKVDLAKAKMEKEKQEGAKRVEDARDEMKKAAGNFKGRAAAVADGRKTSVKEVLVGPKHLPEVGLRVKLSQEGITHREQRQHIGKVPADQLIGKIIVVDPDGVMSRVQWSTGEEEYLCTGFSGKFYLQVAVVDESTESASVKVGDHALAPGWVCRDNVWRMDRRESRVRIDKKENMIEAKRMHLLQGVRTQVKTYFTTLRRVEQKREAELREQNSKKSRKNATSVHTKEEETNMIDSVAALGNYIRSNDRNIRNVISNGELPKLREMLRLAFNEIEHVAPGMLDKKRAWDTIKKMRLGIDIKHAYIAMKAHQLPDGLLDYSSFVETFYDLLASVPSVSDELEQVQQTALRRQAKAMGMVPIDAPSISPEVAADVVRIRRGKTGGGDQTGSMRGTQASDQYGSIKSGRRGSSYNSLQAPSYKSLQTSSSGEIGDEAASAELVPKPPPMRRGIAMMLTGMSDVVGAALARKKEKEQRRLFGRAGSGASVSSEGSSQEAGD